MAHIITARGTVAVTGHVVTKFKSMLVRLERGYFPSRGRGDDVFDGLVKHAGSFPKDFTENSLMLLGIAPEVYGLK